jgi:hypothetical protein
MQIQTYLLCVQQYSPHHFVSRDLDLQGQGPQPGCRSTARRETRSKVDATVEGFVAQV